MISKGQRTKELILKNSRELFYQFGYVNTTLRMIAQKSNTNLGLFQYHFNGKKDIARQIYRDIRLYFEVALLEAEPSITEFDMFFLSSAIEGYLCLKNTHFALFFDEYMKSTTYEDRRFTYIKEFFDKHSVTSSSNIAIYNALCLTVIKPALIGYAVNHLNNTNMDELILFYLTQQLQYIGCTDKKPFDYLELLSHYHIDLGVNFTPVFVKIL